MLPKRRWVKWPGRTAQELNGVAGVAGLGGIAVGASSLAFLGSAALALTGVGTIFVVGAVGYAVVKAFPPRVLSPDELVGKVVDLNTLQNVSPAIRTLAIIGPGKAGKTTLRNRLAFDATPVTRTQQITAYVVSLQTAPVSYLAILDGGGERFAQQFKLAEMCDYLCIVVDHNTSDSEIAVDQSRIAEHDVFLKQIWHHLDESNAPQKLWIHVLINKHDLWKNTMPEQQAALVKFFKDEIDKWNQGRRAKKADFRSHSNDVPNDIAAFMDLLKQTATSSGG